MNRREFSRIVMASTILPVLSAKTTAQSVSAENSKWSFEADVAECCSCAIPCPCNFGRPTDKVCSGNRLIEIRHGHLDGSRDLSGLRFLVTFSMGKWTRIYVDDSLDADQRDTLNALLPLAFSGFHSIARSITYVQMQVSESDGNFRYSVPESEVQMKRSIGFDGNPIIVTGLPSNVLHHYIQYESVVHTHDGPETTWSHSGTNGFRSRMISSG